MYKRQALAAQADNELASMRNVFFDRIGPVILQIMSEKQASVILDRSLAQWALPEADITDLAISRIDQTFVP